MNNYLTNIIPRLKQYSASLNKKEVFIEKPWIFIDEQGNNHEYIFMRDGRLVMALNGNVTEGKWELLPNSKLLINRMVDQIMLQNMFIDDALMALQKSGSNDEPFVLINEKKIPDLNALKYLQQVDEKKLNDSVTDGNKSVVLESGTIIGNPFYRFKKVEGIDGSIVSGVFRSNRKSIEEYVVVKSGVIEETYYVKHYSIDGFDITIHQSDWNSLQKGDKVLNFSKSGIPNRFKAKIEGESYTITLNEEGVITKLRTLGATIFVIGIMIALLVAALAIAINRYFSSNS
ncbi:hypothetical protein [Asinibacterium sp. OR53]|uniref:hypothetical protein n=1 Tax=Asinibacterium sp. OR53 TaxID=925409 RepID=UPI0012FC9D72|nr:hypothetical protein [Asinibacterium sp. OR53]